MHIQTCKFQGSASEDILEEIEDTLKTFPDTLIVHVGTNDLRGTPIYAKKIFLPDTRIMFSNEIYWKDKENTNRHRSYTSTRLKHLVARKIFFSYNSNIKMDHLG